MPLSPLTFIFPFYKLRRVLDADLYAALVDDVNCCHAYQSYEDLCTTIG